MSEILRRIAEITAREHETMLRGLSHSSVHRSRCHRTAGFSLLEMLVTLLVMSIVVVGILAFFDLSNRLSRTQVNIAEMQTTQRVAQQEIVRLVGMSGIGGLPEGIDPTNALGVNTGVFPNGLALAVNNNVPSGIEIGGDMDLPVLPGTDILTLRGVFTTPVMFIEPEAPIALNGAGQFTVQLNRQVDVGVEQDLQPLRDALQGNNPEAIIVYDRYNPEAFAVFELVPGGSTLGASGSNQMTLALTLGSANYTSQYGRMVLGTALKQGSGGMTWNLPDGTTVTLPRNIGALGLLEEYQFYVREEREVPADASSRVAPVLSRARLYPGANVLHPDGSLDLADNVIDLQIALGVDSNPLDGTITEDGSAGDEVLYNNGTDDDRLTGILASEWANPAAQVLFARITTVVQADQADPSFPGAVLGVVEDHDYTSPASFFNTDPFYAKLRKRILQTTVELRNLP